MREAGSHPSPETTMLEVEFAGQTLKKKATLSTGQT